MSADAAFCFVCRKFGLERGCSDKAFSITGYNKWRKALDKFKSHQTTQSHKACYTLWCNRLVKDANMTSITSELNRNHTLEVKANRYHLG